MLTRRRVTALAWILEESRSGWGHYLGLPDEELPRRMPNFRLMSRFLTMNRPRSTPRTCSGC